MNPLSWNKLSPEQQVMSYTPGLGMLRQPPPCISICLWGRLWRGKSAFTETIEHVLVGLQFASFTRQSESLLPGGSSSYTIDGCLVRVAPGVQLIDPPGMRSYDWEKEKASFAEHCAHSEIVLFVMNHSDFVQHEEHAPFLRRTFETLGKVYGSISFLPFSSTSFQPINTLQASAQLFCSRRSTSLAQ